MLLSPMLLTELAEAVELNALRCYGIARELPGLEGEVYRLRQVNILNFATAGTDGVGMRDRIDTIIMVTPIAEF